MFAGVSNATTINVKLEETPPRKTWSAHQLEAKIQNVKSEARMNAAVQKSLRDALSSVKRESVEYLLVNLFRCVVWKSEAVDAVYGVYICGPK